jgi:hypothetical protein
VITPPTGGRPPERAISVTCAAGVLTALLDLGPNPGRQARHANGAHRLTVVNVIFNDERDEDVGVEQDGGHLIVRERANVSVRWVSLAIATACP